MAKNVKNFKRKPLYPDVSAGVVVDTVHEVEDEQLGRVAEVSALQCGQI